MLCRALSSCGASDQENSSNAVLRTCVYIQPLPIADTQSSSSGHVATAPRSPALRQMPRLKGALTPNDGMRLEKK